MKAATKTLITTTLIITTMLLTLTPASTAFRNPIASSVLLAEMDTGMVLYDHNKDTRQPVDALSRIMTLLLTVTACENGTLNPNETIEVTESAFSGIDTYLSQNRIFPGEELKLLDIMYYAYIGESTEACNMLAIKVSGSTAEFVTMMNTRSRDLGCENTNFANAHGQYSIRQYSTASDLFLIMREALNHSLFVEISGSFRHEIEETNLSEPRILINPNAMLNPSSKYYYSPCSSGMVSSTYEGGYSFVSFAESEGLSLISVVLGSDAIVYEDESVDLRNITETKRLYEWGFSQFSLRTVLSTTDIVDKAPVTHGAGADFVNLRPESAVTLLLNNNISDDSFDRIVTIYSVENNSILYAPISAGEVLGEVTLMRNGVDYGTVLLVANTNVELHRMQFMRMQISNMLSTRLARFIIWLLTMIVLCYLALVIRYNVLRRKRLRRIAEAKERLRRERQGMDE